MSGIDALPRSWRFQKLAGRATAQMEMYGSYPLDDQPPLPDADPLLRWLDGHPIVPTWNITGESEGAQPQLQRRIGSISGCYLDLGDFAPQCSDGGRLIHFLSDQQWLLHWLLYVGNDGSEAVIATPEPIGFDLTVYDWPIAVPDIIPLDGSMPLDVCGDSLSEFLQRFWIENRLWEWQRTSRPLPSDLAEYDAELIGG